MWQTLELESQRRLKDGDHICAFYSDLDYHTLTVAKHFRNALNEGRRCIYVSETPEIMYCKLEPLLPVSDIDFYAADEVYKQNEDFSEEKAMSFWNARHGRYQRQGLAIIGNVDWVKSDYLPRLLIYEQHCNIFSEKRIWAICSYSLDCLFKNKLDVISRAHKHTWSDCISSLALTKLHLKNMEQLLN